MNCSEKLGFSRFGKRTPRQIHGIKNHSIWIKIHGEIKEWKLGRKSQEERKTKTESKINLIYDLKLKSNATGRKIRWKTRNLTQSRTWNDPINRRIKGFPLYNFEGEIQRSRYDFFLFSPKNLDLNTP